MRRSLAGLLVAGALSGAWARSAQADVRFDAEFLERLAPGGAPGALTDRSGRWPLMVKLPLGVDARSVGLRAVGPGLGTIRLAPHDLLRFEAEHRGLGYSVWPGLRPVLERSAQLNGTVAYRAALSAIGDPSVGRGKGVVVGLVDTGLDVGHADFRDDEGRTRVAWLIDFAHAPVGRHPELEARYGCDDPSQAPCAVLDAHDIDEALAAGGGAPYRPIDVIGHGTHVASIAAGNGGVERRYVGGAPESTLIVAGVSDRYGGSVADVDIVTGAQFVFDRAAELGVPAVVNMSLGGDFGPHDGTSPIEQSLAALVGSGYPGRALVVAAGNSGGLYEGKAGEALGVHTQTRVTGGLPAQVTVLAPGHGGEQPTDGAGFIWVTYGARDHIVVGLDGPGGIHVPGAAAGAKTSGKSTDGELTASISNGVVDGDSPLTADTHGAVIVWRGTWAAGTALQLWFEGEGFIDAWVQSVPDGALFDVAMREGTINVPATHPDLIAVGCTVNRTDWTDAQGGAHDVATSESFSVYGEVDSPCYFSSAGPSATGVSKPELSAPGAMVAAAMSRDAAPGVAFSSPFDAPSDVCRRGVACLVVDPTHALLSGSSMSAPQVTGAVALLFERDPMLTQPELRAVLQQGARRPLGKVPADHQLGVGALDVRGAMDALASRSGAVTREPDARASWLSLSSAYLRTEPAYALVGTVEVRGAEGQVADGFDPRRLTLEVGEGGIVQAPLARVAAGLWRFALASAPSAGSESVSVVVRLDGAPIGAADSLSGVRELPIGADRWIAFGSARAYGGCAMAGRTLPEGGQVFGAFAVLAAWFALARRRVSAQGARETGPPARPA